MYAGSTREACKDWESYVHREPEQNRDRGRSLFLDSAHAPGSDEMCMGNGMQRSLQVSGRDRIERLPFIWENMAVFFEVVCDFQGPRSNTETVIGNRTHSQPDRI